MKFRLIFILIITCYIDVYSQSTYELDLGVEAIFTNKGVFSCPRIGINFEGFKIQSGVLIGKEYSRSSTVFGGEIDFLFFPNKENNKRFNLFLLVV